MVQVPLIHNVFCHCLSYAVYFETKFRPQPALFARSHSQNGIACLLHLPLEPHLFVCSHYIFAIAFALAEMQIERIGFIHVIFAAQNAKTESDNQKKKKTKKRGAERRKKRIVNRFHTYVGVAVVDCFVHCFIRRYYCCCLQVYGSKSRGEMKTFSCTRINGYKCTFEAYYSRSHARSHKTQWQTNVRHLKSGN